jgi:hypothetical protein
MDLLETMRRRKVNAMVADAHFLREQEPSPQQQDAVEREKRQVMLEYALQRITEAERDLILKTLSPEARQSGEQSPKA